MAKKFKGGSNFKVPKLDLKDETKKGTGLGLAYCKMIMQGYGGDITCESKLGKYTRFALSFPKVELGEDFGASASSLDKRH